MRCVVVTGAGASRELGLVQPLPLMEDWAQALCEELDGRESGLARAFGLSTEMSGQEFEELIGTFLRWRDVRPLNRRFRGLGGKQAGKLPQAVVQANALEDRRLTEIIAGINVTLYRMFSASAINEANAIDAYGNLLSHLGSPKDLTIVTTNYDPAAEIALAGLGLRPDTGFDRPPGRAPLLNPHGLVQRARGAERDVPVIHLHGAVGWYEKEGTVHEQHQDQPFNPNLGRPVVLYPDPNKDPTRDAVVQALWVEFDAALADATHVLVIGHSLHDPALVAKLRAASVNAQVGICVLDLHGPKAVSHGRIPKAPSREAKRVLRLMGREAQVIPVLFGPRQNSMLDAIGDWSAHASASFQLSS